MSTENNVYILSDVEFNEQEHDVIKASINLFGNPLDKTKVYITEEEDKHPITLTFISKMLKKASLHSITSENKKQIIQFALNKISAKLNKWVVSRETHNIMGAIPNGESGLDNEKFFTIEASNHAEAKAIRDELEAEYYNAKSIDITKLLSIINNIERSHGSSTISPTLLKQKIKESL